jgi:carotenoid cleavage dioxygenase-like enzyme
MTTTTTTTTSKQEKKSTGCSTLFVGVAIFFALVAIAASQISAITAVDFIDDLLTLVQNPKQHLATHPYLNGNFAPVAEEHIGVAVEVVQGEIPEGLEGLFVRTGPNPLPGWTKRYHWFDGHGMLHNLRFKDSKATYTNQFIKTPRYLAEKKLDKDYFFRIGELRGITGLLKALLVSVKQQAYGMDKLTNGPANTDTVMYNNQFYLLNEANLPFEGQLNDDGSLVSLEFSRFGGVLDYAVSAHPKVDFTTNTMLFHSYSPDPELKEQHGAYKVGELLANGTVRNYQGIKRNHTSFAHDMMITENWMVICDSSVHFDITKIFESKMVFAWKEDANLKFILVNRKTGEVRTFDTGSPHVIVHMLNAWELSDGTVVVWAPVGDHMELELDLEGTNFYYITELRINPTTDQVSMERIDAQHNQEFCNVRRDFYGRFARFGVCGILDAKTQDGIFVGFIVWDMQEKKAVKVVHYEKDEFSGEPVLIAKPNSSDSRDFYVGTFIHNQVSGKSSFVLYEEETLVTRLNIPYRVPYGFHGKWIPEEQLQSHIASRKQ